MPINVRADELQTGDEVTLCGRPATVIRIATDEPEVMPGRSVHVYTRDSGSDPYLMRPAESVLLRRRP